MRCVKATNFKEHETLYAPAGANQGTAITNTVVGMVILNFDYNPSAEIVIYTVEKKPFIVSASQI